MPFVVLAIAGAYLASMWLRSSGVVFGSEKLSWNLANRITVMRHANQNTALRVMFIAPQAWWRREIAHSYYYKSGRIIRDVADRIADWSNHRATPAWPVEAWLGSAARIFVVLLFVLSIFAVSVPVAIALSKVGTAIAGVLESVAHREIDLAAPGSLPEPKDASGYNQRADAFQTRKYFDRAIADHNKAIAIDPNYATAYNDRGNAHAFLKRDYDLAIADYSKAIELEPSKSLFVDNRGRAYRNKGDYDRAIADHSKAIELAPDNAAAYHNRGVANYLKRDNNAAIADYTKAAELAPSNAEYILARAIAKYRAGDFNGAAQDLSPRSTGGSSRSAPAVADPAATNLYAVLFRYLARTRGGESAAADLEAAAATFKSKDWPYAVAELYLGKRSPDATLAAARTSAERCEGQFYIGQWHLLNNNAAEATNAFKAMVDACDKTDYEYGIALDELERLSR
jgi:tetratricopeptide (TPR) repeat protein